MSSKINGTTNRKSDKKKISKKHKKSGKHPKKRSGKKICGKKYKKKTIPKAIREQCWLKTNGERYKSKCYVSWCKNEINVFDYHVGHNIPESEGGTLSLDNLYPICARCNLSMSNNYTIQEWSKIGKKQKDCCIIS